MTTVGFVGLGSMGLPMAKNLVAKGYGVRGYDIVAAPAEALAAVGGKKAASAAEAAAGADALVVMVVNAAQAESVLFEQGALAALKDNAIVVVMATCAPGAVETIAQKVQAAGRRYIDAPVSGGVVGAQGGTLTIMAAAPDALFAEAKPMLEAMGSKLYHVGQNPGQGAMVKTVNQLLCGVHIAVAAEAMSLAGKAGLDLNLILEILGGSAASSWMLKDRGPRMFEDEPRVTSAVDIFVKDLGIVLDAGRQTRSALPLAAAAHQMYLSVSGQGGGKSDDSQVIRAYHALNK